MIRSILIVISGLGVGFGLSRMFIHSEISNEYIIMLVFPLGLVIFFLCSSEMLEAVSKELDMIKLYKALCTDQVENLEKLYTKYPEEKTRIAVEFCRELNRQIQETNDKDLMFKLSHIMDSYLKILFKRE